jgi:YbbR domain-containing protein
MRALGWLAKNLGTLLLAFALALVVWVSAVIAADPNVEGGLERSIPVEIISQDPGLQIMGNPNLEVSLTLKAPRSVWDQLNNDPTTVRAWVDLANLQSGEYILPVQVQINANLVRLIKQEPETIIIKLENLITVNFPLTVVINGDPPTGYQRETPIVEPAQVNVSGPDSLVSRVNEVRITMDVAGQNNPVTKTVTPVPLDANGRTVTGLTISPDSVQLTQPISLLGGYRYVVVKAVSQGQVANGYRLTNIFVSPVGVVVFSSDPQLVNDLPGYIETRPLDLTDATDDFEMLVELDLSEGISVVGDPKVLVQVSIAAIETSLAVSLTVEIVGLLPGLQAQVAPTTVDVIVSGPVPILDELDQTDIRVKVDLADYDVGTYQLIPVVDFLPEGVRKVSILPATVEVTITLAPTPTPTLTPSITPTPEVVIAGPILTSTPTPKP